MTPTGFAASILQTNQFQQFLNYQQINQQTAQNTYRQQPQVSESWDIPITNVNNNNNEQQTMQNVLEQQCESWDIPIRDDNNKGILNATAPSFTPSTNGSTMMNNNKQNNQQLKYNAYW
eukprot:UN07393